MKAEPLSEWPCSIRQDLRCVEHKQSVVDCIDTLRAERDEAKREARDSHSAAHEVIADYCRHRNVCDTQIATLQSQLDEARAALREIEECSSLCATCHDRIAALLTKGEERNARMV